MQHDTVPQETLSKQKISANINHHWSKMFISLFTNKLGLSSRFLEILYKWLWFESRAIDCDPSRVIQQKNLTRVGSNHQRTWNANRRMRV